VNSDKSFFISCTEMAQFITVHNKMLFFAIEVFESCITIGAFVRSFIAVTLVMISQFTG